MQYNDTTTKLGIVQDAYFEANANSTSYPIDDVTRNANQALDNIAAIAMFASKRWDFGSTNQTDLPIGTTDVLSGQQDYEFDDTFLAIKAIEIQDTNGNWSRLVPIDVLSMEERQAISQFETNNGVPKYYDKLEGSFMLYPAANYNRRLVEEGEAGLKVFFKRKLDYFTASDTTKEPGIPGHLHKYISLYCAYVYARAKSTNREASLRDAIMMYEGDRWRGGTTAGLIEIHYGRREEDVPSRLVANVENTR